MRETPKRTPQPRPTANELIRAARVHARRKTPFRHQGRNRHGLDCIGLIVCSAAAIGLTLPDRTDYPADAKNKDLEKALDTHLVRLLRPEAGAVVLFRFLDTSRHIGIITPDRLIHAWDRVGYTVEHGYTDWFRARAKKIYRIPGLWPN